MSGRHTVLNEFDGQDRVLRGEADQQHETDLALHVQRHAAREQADKPVERREAGGEHHSNRQSPALVQGVTARFVKNSTFSRAILGTDAEPDASRPPIARQRDFGTGF